MSPTTSGRSAVRATVRVRKSISSIVTGTVPWWPSTTIPAVSPTRRMSMPACSARRAPGFERTRQRQRPLALLGREVGVSRREREPVLVADSGQHMEVDGNVEVEHHPPEHRGLLRVFLAEVGDVWTNEVEQLQADR